MRERLYFKGYLIRARLQRKRIVYLLLKYAATSLNVKKTHTHKKVLFVFYSEIKIISINRIIIYFASSIL